MIDFTPPFEYLLSPISFERFLHEYYEKKPMLVFRKDSSYYDQIISIDDVEQFLERAEAITSDFHVVDATKEIYREDYCGPDGHIDLLAMRQFLASGATLTLGGVQRYFPTLMRLCRNAERAFNFPCKVNLYYTGIGGRGLKPHHDTHDVFIMQIYGAKAWRLYETVVSLPLPGQGLYWEDLSPSGQFQEITLEAGDILYCPRGTPHEARAESAPSVHITLGVLAQTWAELLIETISELALREPALRASLPVGFVTGEFFPDAFGKRFRELVQLIGLQARPLQILDRMAEEFIATRKQILPIAGGVLGDKGGLSLDSPIGVCRGLIYRIRERRGLLSLLFYDREVTFPSVIREAVEFVLTTDKFLVREIPGVLDDEGKLVLARRLVEVGLLIRDPI